jgi:hypothetical protein
MKQTIRIHSDILSIYYGCPKSLKNKLNNNY